MQSKVLFSGMVAGMGVLAVGVDGAVVVEVIERSWQLNQFVPKCPISIFQKSCVVKKLWGE